MCFAWIALSNTASRRSIGEVKQQRHEAFIVPTPRRQAEQMIPMPAAKYHVTQILVITSVSGYALCTADPASGTYNPNTMGVLVWYCAAKQKHRSGVSWTVKIQMSPTIINGSRRNSRKPFLSSASAAFPGFALDVISPCDPVALSSDGSRA